MSDPPKMSDAETLAAAESRWWMFCYKVSWDMAANEHAARAVGDDDETATGRAHAKCVGVTASDSELAPAPCRAPTHHQKEQHLECGERAVAQGSLPASRPAPSSRRVGVGGTARGCV